LSSNIVLLLRKPPTTHSAPRRSLVLAGGVVSGLFGPETAKWSRDLFAPVIFAGCYAIIVALYLASAVLLCLVRLPKPAAPALRSGGRPLLEIATQPIFVVAAVAGMVGYGVMSALMTVTPIAMLGCGFAFVDAAFVIQWHSLGMYLPSFITGHMAALPAAAGCAAARCHTVELRCRHRTRKPPDAARPAIADAISSATGE
jgi:hypothetical protein